MGARHDLVDAGLAQEEHAIGKIVPLDQRRHPRRRAFDAVVERMLLDDENGVGGRIGGEGSDEFVDEGGVAAVTGVHDKLRVAGLLQQREKRLAADVREFERARERGAFVMSDAPEILPDIADPLAIDGVAVIIGVEPQRRLEGDGGQEVGYGVGDVGFQTRRKLAAVGRLGRALARFEIDFGIARQAREAVDAVSLQRHPMRPQIAVLQYETVQAEFLGDFERPAIARQGVVECDDGVNFFAPHHAANEPLPVAVAMPIDDPAVGGGLQILAALADSAIDFAARSLDLPRQDGEKKDQMGRR